jgi:hypothetical protein
MAKKTTTKQAADRDDEDGAPTNSAGPPSSFTKRSANQAEGWATKEPGAIVHGFILGRFPKAMEPGKFFYQVRLREPTQITLKGGEIRVAETDEVINVDENGDIRTVKDALAEGHNVVWLRYVERRKQQKDPSKSYWAIEVFTSHEEAF